MDRPLNYKKTLFKLIEALRKLQQFSIKLKLPEELQKKIETVLQKLEKNSFSIAVVGEFKRGKSTFINALLGADILPSDILPTTATINRVTYGLKPSVKIIFHDRTEENIAIDRLSDYVTKLTEESIEKSSTVKEAIIYYPVSYCLSNNLDIIDTPGLSDTADLSEITFSILPEVDAAIFVMMAQSPLSQTEYNFLTDNLLTQDLGKVIFLITGIDLCKSQESAERVVQHIRNKLQEKIIEYAQINFDSSSSEYRSYINKIGNLKVFGVSAYNALLGKINRDNSLVVNSGFVEFEKELQGFLEQERGRLLLQVPTNKAINLSQKISKWIAYKRLTLVKQQNEFEELYKSGISKLNKEEEKYLSSHLTSLATPEIAKIKEKKIDKRVKWERAKVLIEIEIKKLEQMADETKTLLDEVILINEQLNF